MIPAVLRSSLVAIAMALTMPGGPATAQQEAADADPTAQPLRVGVDLSAPFVMEEDGRYTGMAIDLWDMLAEALDLRFDYVEIDTFEQLIEATAAGEIDVAVTNLTITKGRAERIDFTHPWFDAGLRIMVNEERRAGFRDMMGGLQAAGHLRSYAWIATVILTATVLLTIFDRHLDKDFPRRWRDGIAESFHTVMSVATSGKPPSRKNLFGWIGRIWQGLWLVCGVAVLAYVTSSVTSVMTTLSLNNQINSVADLPGRPVGVLAGSLTEHYARDSGFVVHPFASIGDAVAALLDGQIVAIIGDAPVLEYHAHTHPALPLAVVGAIFEPDKYGFGLPHRSALTRPLTVELIGAHESGLIEEIRQTYFGDEP